MRSDKGDGPAVPGIPLSRVDSEHVLRVVNLLVYEYPPLTEELTLLVGSDTARAARSLAGIAAWVSTLAGVRVFWLGQVPLPALAYLARLHQDDDNGGVHAAFYLCCDTPHAQQGQDWLIPLGPGGTPYSQRRCSEIAVRATKPTRWAPISHVGVVEEKKGLVSAYRKGLAAAAPPTSRREVVLVGGQQGAPSAIVALVLRELRYLAVPVQSQCGRNGLNSGTSDLTWLSTEVRRIGAIGALHVDRYGTRVKVLDQRGRAVSGGQLLAFLAQGLPARSQIENRVVVGPPTVGRSLGEALRGLGFRFAPVSPGCADLAAEMRRRGAVLGGDGSGRYVFSGHGPVPDGCLTAVKAAEMLANTQQALSGPASGLEQHD